MLTPDLLLATRDVFKYGTDVTEVAVYYANAASHVAETVAGTFHFTGVPAQFLT